MKETDITALMGGDRILSQHDHFLVNALSSVYPQFEWLPWKFGRV
jgi:hypothetical protein